MLREQIIFQYLKIRNFQNFEWQIESLEKSVHAEKKLEKKKSEKNESEFWTDGKGSWWINVSISKKLIGYFI